MAIDAVERLATRAPRAVVVDAVRDAVERARQDPRAAPHGDDAWVEAIGDALAERERPSLRPLYNATGVILHTNLGRAPLAKVAVEAIAATASGYSNLEYDVERGTRGTRYTHCVALLRELTGAEDAIVVNNCAAALVLVLNALADGGETLVSRGELIEIGGSFRVPDIMAKSGTRLVEVGTTNRTHRADYASALTQATRALLKVHRSNFALEGFVAEATLADLASLAAEHGLPLIHDFGSGLLISLETYGLHGEPTARDAIRHGATVVLMSGDKMLGGPQAGLIVGSAAAVGAARRNPLARALRVDKLTLAALEATLALYRDPVRAVHEVPALAMLTAPAEAVRHRAEKIRARLAEAGVAVEIVASEATVGGGAFPTARIASTALALPGPATEVERCLRLATPGIIGRIVDGRCQLDVRTVPAANDGLFADAVRHALG